jgi:hypothetical protein
MSEMVDRVTKAIEDHCWVYEARQPVDPIGIAFVAIAAVRAYYCENSGDFLEMADEALRENESPS